MTGDIAINKADLPLDRFPLPGMRPCFSAQAVLLVGRQKVLDVLVTCPHCRKIHLSARGLLLYYLPVPFWGMCEKDVIFCCFTFFFFTVSSFHC